MTTTHHEAPESLYARVDHETPDLRTELCTSWVCSGLSRLNNSFVFIAVHAKVRKCTQLKPRIV